ncbi:MAG: C2 domain-containing protein, partial [Myxococcota bacterium]
MRLFERFALVAFLGCSLFFLGNNAAHAFFGSDSNGDVKYIKITVKRAMLWPVRDTGRCFDPCLGKRFSLPKRDKDHKTYSKYFESESFRKACTGTWAPDAFVEIKVGKYGKFTTTKVNNTCTPQWKGVSKVFRVAPKDKFVVSVYDNDGVAGFQAKRDLMGRYESATVPARLLAGRRLILKRFGQVEALVLKAEVVNVKQPEACTGVYNVRVVE